MEGLLRTDLPLKGRYEGKVRDTYKLPGKRRLVVATDRVSAFDHVLDKPVPGKGEVLTSLSAYWFRLLAKQVPGLRHHMITDNADNFDEELTAQRDLLRGRSMIAHDAKVYPYECVVRGYLDGSAWEEYRANKGVVAGTELPKGLVKGAQLPQPLFTPATKEAKGKHDINITFAELVERAGPPVAQLLRRQSIAVYSVMAAHAAKRGLRLVDTKMEWGTDWKEELLLVDEVGTPDCSRFIGIDGRQYDKQMLRDWLTARWNDKAQPPPGLSDDIVFALADRYREVQDILMGPELVAKY